MDNNSERMTKRNPFLSGLFSLFVPGLGHIYVGLTKKAMFYHIGAWICLFLSWTLVFCNTFISLIITHVFIVIYWIVVFVDAIVSTAKRKMISFQKGKTVLFYIFAIVIFIVVSRLISYPAKKYLAMNQSYKVATSAMSPLIELGDYVIVQKTKSVERNDIISFELNDTVRYMYRCVALSGDTLQLKNGLVYINNNLTENDAELKFGYFFQSDSNISFLDGFEYEKLDGNNEGLYVIFMTNQEKKQLQESVSLDFFSFINNKPDDRIFAYSPFVEWNSDYYGPIIIPQKGETIKMSFDNVLFYASLIQLYEGEKNVRVNEANILEINRKMVSTYTFKHDYYYLMGDNRHNAVDSRFWGAVPDYKIKGKVQYILASQDINKIGKNINQ